MKGSLSIVLLVAALAGVACTSCGDEGPPPHSAEILADAEILRIAEATFRYQFENNASGQQQEAPAYFLTLFDKDPTLEFLTRFEGHEPPVRKGSDFVEGGGLRFRVESVKRVSGTMVEVSGGYYEAGLSASGNTYFVERKDGEWVVTGDEMHWIS